MINDGEDVISVHVNPFKSFELDSIVKIVPTSFLDIFPIIWVQIRAVKLFPYNYLLGLFSLPIENADHLLSQIAHLFAVVRQDIFILGIFVLYFLIFIFAQLLFIGDVHMLKSSMSLVIEFGLWT